MTFGTIVRLNWAEGDYMFVCEYPPMGVLLWAVGDTWLPGSTVTSSAHITDIWDDDKGKWKMGK